MNYEQIISFLKDLRPHMSDQCKEKLDGFFPELCESEDEKIRKEIISYIKSSAAVTNKKWIAWLEKQGEQKPWSEEDEKMLDSIIEEIRPFGECPDYPTDEDREYYYGRTEMIDWLKSIKPNNWKPSEEQLSSLGRFIEGVYGCVDFVNIKSLYNDLKNL